jgi:type VI secretion system protein ImpF
MPSILDRLIDPESEGTAWRQGYGLDSMIDSVRRDLEELLNTHQMALEIPRELTEVRKSIITFGVPDMLSFQLKGQKTFESYGAAIEEVIARFEPRLGNVRARLIESDDKGKTRLEFEIKATLRVDPAPEVAFMTILKLSTGQTSIQQVAT